MGLEVMWVHTETHTAVCEGKRQTESTTNCMSYSDFYDF